MATKRRALANTMVVLAVCWLVKGGGSPGRGEDGGGGGTAAATAAMESGTTDGKSIDLKNGGMGSLALCGQAVPAVPAAPEMRLVEQTLRPGGAAVVLRIALPAGYEINADAPSRVTVSSDGVASVEGSKRTQRLAPGSRESQLSLKVVAGGGTGSVRVEASIYYCRKGKTALCHLVRPSWTVPVRSAPDGATTVTIDYRVTPPAIDGRGRKDDA